MITLTSHPKYPCTRATEKSAGYDLRTTVDFTIRAGECILVPTGVFVEMPADVVAFVCPRSSLALRNVTVMNSPGIIDADYTGEVRVILFNADKSNRSFLAGERIAQLVFANWLKASDVVEVKREGGFGSTGA